MKVNTIKLISTLLFAAQVVAQTPCVISGTLTCPSPLICTPTESPPATGLQSGECITPAPPGPTSACLVSNPVTTCSVTTQTCSPFYTTCTSSNCLGTCISAPTPPPQGKPCDVHGWKGQCPDHSECVPAPGCQPWYCPGHCEKK